eukprot:7183151-Lingulodinium_polyedra.AAC.1
MALCTSAGSGEQRRPRRPGQEVVCQDMLAHRLAKTARSNLRVCWARASSETTQGSVGRTFLPRLA